MTTTMASTQTVAVWSLMYREARRRHWSGNPATADGYDDTCLLEDFEACPGERSLIAMVAARFLSSVDWTVVELLERPEPKLAVAVAADMSSVSPLRVEALLHALRDDPRAELTNEEWAQPFIERWPLVEDEMAALEPLTAKAEEIDDLAKMFQYDPERTPYVSMHPIVSTDDEEPEWQSCYP